MSAVAAQPFSGTYRAQPVYSTFAFAVRHSGVFWNRGSLSDVAATLRGDGDGLVLEGSARVDSISVVEPAAMRASVLGPEFFDAERHPEITFRSTAVRLAGDGRAEVDGELTIRGVTCPVIASGQYAPPRQAGFGEAAGLQLQTSFDRREFGFEWQSELPGGGDAVSWDVEVDIDLLLMRAEADAEG
jgi:polyisoprenoid-binding protein YceI